MKRLFSALTALGLISLLCVNVLAAASAELVRVFVYEGTLYAYIDIAGTDQPVTKADAKIGAQTFPASGRMETVRQAGSPVTYLLLLDNSTSMPAFRAEVDAFAAALAENSGENTRYILATFGDSFAVAAEDVAAEGLAEAIAQAPFSENVTRLHTSIDQALLYFEGLPRERNELRSMVVLSDAVQYDPAGGVPYEELLERISHSDVMLHSVGLGGDADALSGMGRLAEASGGSHLVIGNDLKPADAAAGLVEHTSRLFVTGFDISGYAAPGGEETVSVTFASGGELLCRAETVVELPPSDGAPAGPPPAQTPPADPDPVPPKPTGQGGGAAQMPAPAEEDRGNNLPVLLIAAVLAAAVIAAVIVLVVVLRKKKTVPETNPAAETTPSAPEAVPALVPGIFMKLEILEDGVVVDQRELELVRELLAGSDSSCGIFLAGSGLGNVHARIFLSEEGRVCIENLDTQNGTLVNGERLEAPRILRSGDEISLGNVMFRLKF